MIAFLYSAPENSVEDYQQVETEEEEGYSIPETSILKPLLILIFLIGSFLPLPLPSEYLSPWITVLTGILIVLPGKSALIESKIMNSWYLRESNQTVFILSLILFSINIGLLYQRDISSWLSPPEITNRLDGLKDGEHVSYAKAKHLNREWAILDGVNLRTPTCRTQSDGMGYCRHTGLDTKNGTYKFMLIGNSMAANHARLFYQECGPKAKSIYQMSIAICEPLYHLAHGYDCSDGIENIEKQIKIEQPDYLFIFSRFIDIGDPMPPNVTSLENDPVYKEMKNHLDIHMESVQKKATV
uniref:SGNH domain-containing protein n=1 Tax=Caenorhabditis tropicalis TaxID=1561998 RepID=A0A1I7UEB4_9PELO